jgi:hypothetical protein
MAWYTSKREDQQDTIYIFFSDEENVSKKTVRKCVNIWTPEFGLPLL